MAQFFAKHASTELKVETRGLKNVLTLYFTTLTPKLSKNLKKNNPKAVKKVKTLIMLPFKQVS